MALAHAARRLLASGQVARCAGRHGSLTGGYTAGLAPHCALHQRALHTASPVCAAAAAGDAAPAALSARIQADMKAAMKARDTARLEAVRFLSAAVKSREIELREKGSQVTDAEVLAVIGRLVKQRKDSIEQYKAGGRSDLADKEAAELQVLEAYLPAQLSRAEVEAAVAAAVAEVGATSTKQMGQVMKAVSARTAGAADNKLVSELVKAALAAAGPAAAAAAALPPKA